MKEKPWHCLHPNDRQRKGTAERKLRALTSTRDTIHWTSSYILDPSSPDGRDTTHLLMTPVLTVVFPGDPGSWSVTSSSTWSRTEPLGINRMVFLQAWCPSSHTAISVKALKGTQSTNSKPGWPHPPSEALLPSRCLSESSTIYIV